MGIDRRIEKESSSHKDQAIAINCGTKMTGLEAAIGVVIIPVSIDDVFQVAHFNSKTLRSTWKERRQFSSTTTRCLILCFPSG
jgi:hypothetical protein